MRARWVWGLLLAAALGLSFTLAARSPRVWKLLISARFPRIEWVDPETLSHWMKRESAPKLVLLDVRTPAEHRVSHLWGAQYLDPGSPSLESLAIPKDATVVVYCSIGYRSASVMGTLTQAGVRNVYNLEGGIFDWASHDRPIYRDGRRVREVHPFNRLWGQLLRRDLRAGQALRRGP